MTDWVFWILLTLAQATALHFALVWAFPRILSRRVARMGGLRGRFNVIHYVGLMTSGAKILTPNPDMPSAFGMYNLAGGPVRISCALPPFANYWSIALYTWDGEAFCVRNDRTAKASRFDLVIVPRGSSYIPRAGEEVAISHLRRGVIIVRMALNDRNDADELRRIEEVIRQTRIVGQLPSGSTLLTSAAG
jgi:uncharacterized membrane protein